MVASPKDWREMCFSLPAVRALAAAGSPITILCPEPQKEFWLAAKVGEVTSYPQKASARAIALQLDGTERALFWEAGVAADACARAGVKEMIGLPAPKLVKQLTRKLDRTVVPGPAEHDVRRMLDTAELMGSLPLQGEFFKPIQLQTEPQTDALLVVPESDYGLNYEWNPDGWVQVIEWLKQRSWVPHIGMLRQGGLAQQIADKSECKPLMLDLSDPLSYASYPLCLAADGSLPHLAGAFGATCAVLFGPGDPVLSRPLSQRHIIIRRKVECSPCFLEKCPLDLRCQNDLDAERVIERLASFNPA